MLNSGTIMIKLPEVENSYLKAPNRAFEVLYYPAELYVFYETL